MTASPGEAGTAPEPQAAAKATLIAIAAVLVFGARIALGSSILRATRPLGGER